MELKLYKVYVLKSLLKEITYVGFTNNISRRILEHNSGKSDFTKKFKPWKIIYFEDFENKEDAIKREKYLKSAAGRKQLKQIINKI